MIACFSNTGPKKIQVAEKSTSEHFRNFLRIDDVEGMLNTHGMKTSYLAQGIGFAKWKNDDAYVARHIVELTK